MPQTFVMPSPPQSGADEEHGGPDRSPSPARKPAETKPKNADHCRSPSPTGKPAETKPIPTPASPMKDPNMPKPPQKLSPGAVDKRLRRVMTPKVDGSYKVPQQVIDEWKDLDTRDRVRALFEKTAYCPDRGVPPTLPIEAYLSWIA